MALLVNKYATSEYEIIEKYEAGIALLGFEVKSLRKQQGSLKESYIASQPTGLFLIKAHIPPFQPGNTPPTYDPYRARKLLLHKKELEQLQKKSQEKGLTIIPLSLYNKGNLLKLEIALVRGKKKHDKRDAIKKKEANREMNRVLKNSLR